MGSTVSPCQERAEKRVYDLHRVEMFTGRIHTLLHLNVSLEIETPMHG